MIGSQTRQNSTLEAVLPTRKTRCSLIHQNTGTSTLHQEAYTPKEPTIPTEGRHQNNRNYEPAAYEKETPNTVS